MKDKLILLIDADADCAGTVLEAAARTAHGVRLGRDTSEAFAVLSRDFDLIDTIIVDLDPGSQGLALLEAIAALHCRPPIIVLTALEESHVEPIVARHGAAACLGKPFSIERLRRTIDRIADHPRWGERSCDPWGHPREQEKEVENGAHA